MFSAVYISFNSLFIFPQAGPDIKYLLGFIRTQLSTSVTVGLVFGPKVSIYVNKLCVYMANSLSHLNRTFLGLL